MEETSTKKSTYGKGKMSDTKGQRLIADTPEELRPREKAMRLGLKALSNAELMAIVFSTGIKGKGVMALCDEIPRIVQRSSEQHRFNFGFRIHQNSERNRTGKSTYISCWHRIGYACGCRCYHCRT